MAWNKGSKVPAETVWAAWCVACQSYVVEEESYPVMQARYLAHQRTKHAKRVSA